MTTIEILSELRSNYNCFNEQEEPVYRALSDAIKALSAQPEPLTVNFAREMDRETIEKLRLCHLIWLISTLFL